jgi:hypothetical protein
MENACAWLVTEADKLPLNAASTATSATSSA